MDGHVGFRLVELVEDGSGAVFPMAVMYPTAARSTTERLGPFSLDVAIEGAPEAGNHPLVLISHGSGGSYLTHRLLAHHLAMHGFVVGLPEHPFNNRHDNSLAGTIEILAKRPSHIRTAADWLFDRGPFANCVRPDAFSVVGHSLGGYTALAVAGGVPSSLPHESADGAPARIDTLPDPRVEALVLLAPATPWFGTAGALAGVHTPILMLAGDKDELCPYPYMPQIVLDGVPDTTKVEFRLIENAGHYSFLSPWPESMTDPAFPPSQDPPGFDRRRFMHELNAEVLGFLVREVHRPRSKQPSGWRPDLGPTSGVRCI